MLKFTRRAMLAGVAMLGAACLSSAVLAPGAIAQIKPVEGKIKVAAIYTVPVEQQWVSRIHKALNAAKDRGEVEYVYSENVTNTDYERVMREYAQKGNNLIDGEVVGVERAARKVAGDFPGTAFLMGSSFGPAGKNFSVFDNWIQEPSFLTGMIAGAMTKSNVIGMVGGYPIPEVNRLMQAFMDGARETNPNVKFLVSFIGSWFDPPKAKEAAFAQIDRGADVLYAERFGVTDAAKEKGKLAIGNVIDTQAQYPDTIVASALWHMEPTINAALAKVKNGSFTAEDYAQYSTMKFDGASLAPLGTFEGKVPAEIVGKVKAREAEIRDGLFRVNVNDAEPKPTL
ncbi:MAG: BMP family protein [Ferrovibrionaceae bacterium]